MLKRRYLYLACILILLLDICYIKIFARPYYNKVTDYIYTENGINSNEVDCAEQYLSCMPECIQTKFTDGGWKIVIVNNIGRYNQNTIAGHTSIEDKTVYIAANYLYDCLLHEFAHIYLDEHPYGDDFLEIYEKEAKAIVTAYYSNFDYYYTDPVEFYCTAWTIVNFRKEDYLGVAPETFAYFTDLFNRLYGTEQGNLL